MKFKEKILYAHAKLNIFRIDLASKLNVSFWAVNRWESGKDFQKKG